MMLFKMTSLLKLLYGSSCGDYLKEQNSHRCCLFHTGWFESVRCSMEKCHINVLLRLAEMWRLTPGYWFTHGLTGEAMDLALAATINPFEMSRNQRSREMVSAHASGRNDDTLWCVARPEYNDSSTGHDAQTAVLLCVVPPEVPPLTEKHDSNPLIQTPECHSGIKRQIIHQWDTVPPLLPPLQQRRCIFFQPLKDFKATLFTL